MERRTFLATAIAGGTTAVAGCGNVIGDPVALRPTETQLDDDGEEMHHRYEVDGRRRAVITLQQRGRRSAPDERFGLSVHVSHHVDGEGNEYEDSTIERFHFDLRAPAASVDPPAEIYLKPIGSAGWPVQVETVDDRWTRLSAEDASEFGSGTITLSTIVDPFDAVDEIGFRAGVVLSNGGLTGESYRLEANTSFEPVVEG